jgi:hypothetical protein
MCGPAFAIATGIDIVGALGVLLLSPWLDHFTVIPLYLACVTIPIYGLVQVQAGIAQSYDWPNLALMPFYIWRQLTITVLMGSAWALGAPTDAVTAMIIAVVTTWTVTIGQLVVLERRLKHKVAAGPKRYEPKIWLATSLLIFVVEGFYLLLTYVDILALEQLGSPDEVAIYYAAARLLALVAFVYFAIAGATTHKFSVTCRRQGAAGQVLRRDHPLDGLAVARHLRGDPCARPPAAVAVRRQLRERLHRDVHPRHRHASARRGRPGRAVAQHAGRAQALPPSMPRPSRSTSRCAYC